MALLFYTVEKKQILEFRFKTKKTPHIGEVFFCSINKRLPIYFCALIEVTYSVNFFP